MKQFQVLWAVIGIFSLLVITSEAQQKSVVTKPPESADSKDSKSAGGKVAKTGSGKVLKVTDGSVTGHVILRGVPLEKGRIFFHLDDGQFVGSKIKDGNFQLTRVQTGSKKVTIEGDGIPAKYTFDDKSGLVANIEVGDNLLDFNVN